MPQQLTTQQQQAIRAAWQANLDVIAALSGEETAESAAVTSAAEDAIEAFRACCPPCDPTDG